MLELIFKLVQGFSFFKKWFNKIWINFLRRIKFYKIIFYGDSLIYGGYWGYKLRRFHILSKGFSSYTSSQLLWLINNNVLIYNPKHCFIMCGVNDLFSGIPRQRVERNINEIIELLIKNEINPILHSVLHTNRKEDNLINNEIFELNLGLL